MMAEPRGADQYDLVVTNAEVVNASETRCSTIRSRTPSSRAEP
jgi:hypothetical protein